MGSGGGASSSIASSPRAKASAAAKVAATLSSGDAASRQARAAADSDAVTSWLLWERLQPRSWDSRRQQTPLPLRLVRAQLLDAFELARLVAVHALAAETRTAEPTAGDTSSGHGGTQVGLILVKTPVDTHTLLRFPRQDAQSAPR